MRLNSKLTWGLAWAGLAVVIAVPSVDFFTAKTGKTVALLTSTTDPVKTAAVTTIVTPNGITITPAASSVPSAPADPVGIYLKSNKALPDYISNDNASSALAPPATAPTEVATIDPVPPAVAPVPFPARPPDVVAPTLPKPEAPVASAPQVANVEPSSMPYVVDEPPPPAQQATLDQPPGPIPPEPIVDDSAQWHTQSLQKYLDQNGLTNDSSTGSTAEMRVVNRSDANYDPNGFYLSDGPNNPRAQRRRRVLQMLNDDSEDDGDAPDFTLF